MLTRFINFCRRKLNKHSSPKYFDKKPFILAEGSDTPKSSNNRNPFTSTNSKLFHQNNFYDYLVEDIKKATKSLVITSGFITLKRVNLWRELFSDKISKGVKIRCVTRPASNQGSIPENSAQRAIKVLRKIGVVVDLDYSIHEKSVFIDENIFWFGSLNFLSYTGKEGEKLMRIESRELCLQNAMFEALKRDYYHKDLPFSIITEKGNPNCSQCNNPATFRHEAKSGRHFYCEKCQWKVSIDKFKPKDCHKCSNKMVLKNGRYGPFWGCSAYPECSHTVNYLENKY